MMDSSRARVLVVEDDPRTADVFCEALRRAGFDVEGTANLGAAIEALRRAPIHVIVTNLQLPDAGPLDVLAALRGTAPDRPIVVCSGFMTDQLWRHAVDFGAVAVLEKPVPLKMLVDTVAAA